MRISLRPLRDFVLLRPVAYKHPILEVCGITLTRGEVIAVGPGRRVRRKIPFRKFDYHEGTKDEGCVWVEDGAETGEVRPVAVKIGDIIEYGSRGATAFRHEGQELIVVPEQSIYGVVKSDSHEDVIFEQRSAPICEG